MTQQDQFGPNPFRPGAGREPPHLAGRDAVLGWWRRALAEGKSGKGEIVLMYGPRGMGKTVVMARFGGLAAAEGFDVVATNVAEIDKGQAGLADRLLATVAHGALAARLKAHALKKPLVILIDEMHSAEDMNAVRELANAGQEVAEQAPFFLLLTGTPGLPQTLKDAKCTFAERAKDFGIGLLDVATSKDAIRTPLLNSVWRLQGDTRLAISDAALDDIVRDSQGYPYFLQIWGYEIWEYGAVHNKDALKPRDIARVRETVERERQAFYEKRGSEISRDDEILTAANAVALAFERYTSSGDESLLKRRAIAGEIAKSLEPAYPDRRALAATREKILDDLIKIGFVWMPPGEARLTPGIPSYMNYAKGVYSNTLLNYGDPLSAA